ncbi:helix-turn-helix domain-containing protein [Oceanirhabdus sp. W0125-5]|uniref:helix-turn-helix domain-containing protein n=1 Tax=Oceanirhabdus sp. W0125-5 TaxID=2999116 RepID=UPI0022F32D3B|nr:helix-turn-helix transcriptional regulator [Oceanirhabdus sp. W0125-5]WBW99132.1 helix-turn-helix transcriptional regulator [Oceanirhabdus sp. W0125-5]
MGQKNRIKEYRRMLGITQLEMADGKMSKSHFQALESNKKRLTFKKAIVLADIINDLADKKGIDISVKASDLIVDSKDLE